MLKNEIQSTIKTGKKESDMINMSKKMISFTTKTLSFGVMVLLILFTIVTMTGSALPDNESSGQMNSESVAVYVLDAGHHHLGDGVKPELMPADAEGTVYTKTFVLERIDGDTAGITLTTKSVVPTDTAGIGLFYDQVYVNGDKVGKLNDYIEAKEQDNLPRSVTIYFSTKLLHSGENNITITSGCNADCSNYDDFEFYDLRLEIIPESKYQYSENVRPPLKEIWSSSIGGYRNTRLPVVSESGELIYYTSSQVGPDTTLSKEMINAIDARNGEVVWSHETGGSWELHDHVVYAEGLVFASDYENIYAFGDGDLKWKFNLKPYRGDYISAPEVHQVVYNSTVYTTIYNAGKVVAIDAKTGELKWIYSFGPGQEPPDKEYWVSYDSTIPAASKGIVVFIAQLEYREKIMAVAIEEGTEDQNALEVEYIEKMGEDIPIEPEMGDLNTPAPTPDTRTFTRVFALNTSNGEEIWNYSINSVSGLSEKTPFIYNDLVYFGLDDKIVARTLSTGRPIWNADVSWPHIYAVSGGKVFASAGSDVVALDAYNGSSIWKYQGSSGPLSVYGDLVYVGIFGNENLLVIDGDTGEQVWKGGRTFGYGVSQPVLSHGRLYMSASDSRLYAFEHGEPGMQDIKVSAIGYLPVFAVGAMLILLVAFVRKIENRSLALGSWLLALAVVLFLSNIIMLEYIPEAGWGMGLLVFMALPAIIVAGILLLAYGMLQKRKFEKIR
ncbi:MAG: PQQ-binding-like beta-propeller repeat protein [Methanosarcinaceae archaeon]|nr:PQQ-binding-like beta-propeller repeat protein [Methanosarcinaceae archaeon]